MKPRNVVLMMVIMAFCYRYVTAQHQKTYIVHMDKAGKPSVFTDHMEWYETSMRSVSESASMLYAYDKVMHGFSTRLTVDEARLLRNQPGIISVQEEVIYELHTTRSPEFLGLERSDMTMSGSTSGGDVIVGVVDTGVWPGSKSLDDTGFGPVPSSWKGECESGTRFNLTSCNKKLIGARYFSRAYEAAYGPIDDPSRLWMMTDTGHILQLQQQGQQSRGQVFLVLQKGKLVEWPHVPGWRFIKHAGSVDVLAVTY